MSKSKGTCFSDYYSDAKQVRQYVNERIETLKQLLDERRLQLNIELDNIELEKIQNDEKNKELTKKCIEYESLTITIFGKEDGKLASIKSKITTLEKEMLRKKIFLQWKDDTLVNNFECLGVVAYESNDIYVTVEKQFKEEMASKAEKVKGNKTLKQDDVADMPKESYIIETATKERPPIAKKPTIIYEPGKNIYKNKAEITDPSMLTETLYENLSVKQPVEHEYFFLTNEGVKGEKAALYEIIDEDDDTKLESQDQGEGSFYEIIDEEGHTKLESQDETHRAVKSLDEQTSIDTNEQDDDLYYESFEEYSNSDILTTSTVRSRYKENCAWYDDSIKLRFERSSPLEGYTLYNPEAGKIRSGSGGGSRTLPQTKKISNSLNLVPFDDDNGEQEYQVINESRLVNKLENTGGFPEIKTLKHAKSTPSINKLTKKRIYDLPIMEWGDQGMGIGRLHKPKAVCVSEKGNIFVVEKGNSRVQVFTRNGTHLYMFSDNVMLEPNGIWVSNQFVYITLPNQNTIQMFTLQGGFVKKKSKEGKEEGRFKLPCGISGDSTRRKIYICDTGNNRIQIFDTDLHFIKVLNTKTPLYRPLDIKLTSSGTMIIVLDRSATCIHMFKCSGEIIKEIIEIQSFPKLINPLYFTIDTKGNILLSDYSSNCIHVFTEEGELVWSLGEAGRGKPFIEPRGIAIDAKGRLITVCNKKKAQLQIFEI
ncbi:Cell surface protein [Oopsacas minuta]|uniref:Cell surface protein n=1 Tax=Oopsacas minuta TaxID=111878 RepID=A0AAV7K8Z0_9METZ|nr:Cell surface protein [Oopsacas minuta]